MKSLLSLLFVFVVSLSAAQTAPDSSFIIPDTLDLARITDSTRFKPLLRAGNPHSYSLEIRDQWGEKIFTTDIYQQGWNGKLQNRRNTCAEGTYMWILQFIELKDTTKHVATGFVTLINAAHSVITTALDTLQCHPEIYVPNAFTPNGDGLHDVVIPRFGCPPSAYEFYIFDRWGNTIFQTTDPSIGWDGNVNGRPAAMDVYVYKVICRFYEGDELHEFRGHISVLR